jgi:hypothetical protein
MRYSSTILPSRQRAMVEKTTSNALPVGSITARQATCAGRGLHRGQQPDQARGIIPSARDALAETHRLTSRPTWKAFSTDATKRALHGRSSSGGCQSGDPRGARPPPVLCEAGTPSHVAGHCLVPAAHPEAGLKPSARGVLEIANSGRRRGLPYSSLSRRRSRTWRCSRDPRRHPARAFKRPARGAQLEGPADLPPLLRLPLRRPLIALIYLCCGGIEIDLPVR